MTAGHWLILGGGLLQLAGVTITLVGALQTWNRFRPDERLWAPAIGRIAPLKDRAWSWIRVRLGLARTHYASAQGTASVQVTASATGRKMYRQLPADMDEPEAITELDERTRELINRIYDAADRSDARSKAIEESVSEVKADIASLAAEQRRDTREAAAGGVRTILVGLIVTGIGIFAVTLGSVPPVA